MATIAKASQQLLLDEINRSNGLTANPLTLQHMAMGFPTKAMDDNVYYNTNVILYGIPQGGYYGKVEIRYRRYDLPIMFKTITPVIIADPSPKKISDLLPLLNAQFGLALVAADIEDADIPDGTEDGLVDIIPTGNNWAWIGTLRVRFIKTLPYLEDVVLTLDIGSLNAGLVYTDKPRAEYLTYGYDWDELKVFLNAVGIGLPITQADVDIINDFLNINLVIKEPADVNAGEINVKDATWFFRGSTESDEKYNSADYKYVVELKLDETSNYEGTMFFHF